MQFRRITYLVDTIPLSILRVAPMWFMYKLILPIGRPTRGALWFPTLASTKLEENRVRKRNVARDRENIKIKIKWRHPFGHAIFSFSVILFILFHFLLTYYVNTDEPRCPSFGKKVWASLDSSVIPFFWGVVVAYN